MANWRVLCIAAGDAVPKGWEPFSTVWVPASLPGQDGQIIIYLKKEVEYDLDGRKRVSNT